MTLTSNGWGPLLLSTEYDNSWLIFPLVPLSFFISTLQPHWFFVYFLYRYKSAIVFSINKGLSSLWFWRKPSFGLFAPLSVGSSVSGFAVKFWYEPDSSSSVRRSVRPWIFPFCMQLWYDLGFIFQCSLDGCFTTCLICCLLMFKISFYRASDDPFIVRLLLEYFSNMSTIILLNV